MNGLSMQEISSSGCRDGSEVKSIAVPPEDQCFVPSSHFSPSQPSVSQVIEKLKSSSNVYQQKTHVL